VRRPRLWPPSPPDDGSAAPPGREGEVGPPGRAHLRGGPRRPGGAVEGDRDALGETFLEGVALRALGAHRLKDLEEPLTLFDVAVDGLDDRFPPLHSIGSRPTNLIGEPVELLGRDDELAAIAALLDQQRLVTPGRARRDGR
jgi:hypothetical protein